MTWQGNLGWAYMQKSNFMVAEVVYKKAQMVDPDSNKACNLGLSLIKQARYDEARQVLLDVLEGKLPGSDDTKSRKRADELLMEVESRAGPSNLLDINLDNGFLNELEHFMSEWAPSRSKRLPIFEEISSFRDQLAC